MTTTCLAAHALPPEAQHAKDHDIGLVTQNWLPEIATQGLADAVDAVLRRHRVFAEQVACVFDPARRLNLPTKLHADQLSNLGGADLARPRPTWNTPTRRAGHEQRWKIAVMLPGAYYFTRESNPPPIDLFRRYGVPMALATDCNPGSASASLPLSASQMPILEPSSAISRCRTRAALARRCRRRSSAQ